MLIRRLRHSKRLQNQEIPSCFLHPMPPSVFPRYSSEFPSASEQLFLLCATCLWIQISVEKFFNKVWHCVILRYELNYPCNSIILADYKSRRETTSLRSVSLASFLCAPLSAFCRKPEYGIRIFSRDLRNMFRCCPARSCKQLRSILQITGMI